MKSILVLAGGGKGEGGVVCGLARTKPPKNWFFASFCGISAVSSPFASPFDGKPFYPGR